MADPIQDDVEAVGLAVAKAVEGDNFDPFQQPEAFDFACTIARAAIAALSPRLSAATELDEEGEAKVCTGCGTTQTVEGVKASHPGAFTCCPERKMIRVRQAISAAKEEGIREERERAARVAEKSRIYFRDFAVANGADECCASNAAIVCEDIAAAIRKEPAQ